MESINPKCDRCPHEDTLICDTCEDNGIILKEEEIIQDEDLHSRSDNRNI